MWELLESSRFFMGAHRIKHKIKFFQMNAVIHILIRISNSLKADAAVGASGPTPA